jgi:hypothetical protein
MYMWMCLLPVWLVIFAALFLAYTQIQDKVVILIIVGVTTFLCLIFALAIIPTRYQIFNDRIRIVLGWMFHFDIPFHNMENAKAATWKDLWGLNFNFISCFSSVDILRIKRRRGAKIHINPSNRKLFLEHLNKALIDYGRNNIS